MNWFIVLLAGMLEVLWATGLKYADSLTDWVVTVLLISISFLLLIRSYKTLPLAAAYTVFVGIGTAGTYFMGIYLGEPFSFLQLLFVTLLLSGVVGMKLSTTTKADQNGGNC
ncbi:SMR family transporter [Bacillus sp. B190/17]|uniref:SMR family transporter n=1 Tax=Bacillus lumedeiriae TaxID=3058829 RepID=A0ABW8IAT7_9BACI